MAELLDKGDRAAFAEMMTGGAFSPGFKSRNPGEFKNYVKVKMQSKPDGLARVIRTLSAPASPPDLSRVKCPVLLIVGENDPYIGAEQAKKIREEIVGSKVVVLPAGHAAIEMPDRFNAAVLEFLSGLSK